MAVSRQVQRSEGEEKEAGIKPRYIQGRNIQGKTIIRAEPRLNGLGAVTSARVAGRLTEAGLRSTRT